MELYTSIEGICQVRGRKEVSQNVEAVVKDERI